MMNGPGKSDRPAVPEKSPNNAGQPAAEGMEGKGLAKGNLPQQNASRTPSRKDAPSALERVRQAARRKEVAVHRAPEPHLQPGNAPHGLLLAQEGSRGGRGRETWQHYGEKLEGSLQDLSERLKRGAYRAKPVRRVYIPKADGRQRPLGVPALEDKIVQRAAVEVLNAIYETDFSGSRPGSARAKPASSAGRALYGTADEKGELGARSGYSQLFRWAFPRMAGEIHRAPDRRSARRAADPEMAQRRRAGGWETNTGGGRDAPGRQCLAAVGERLSALRCARKTWCFQRVFPPRQEVQPPHRESSLGSEETTNRTKRRQSDERAVTKVKRLSLVKYLTAGRQHRSGWEAPVGTPQRARWPETAAGSVSTARWKGKRQGTWEIHCGLGPCTKRIEYAGR